MAVGSLAGQVTNVTNYFQATPSKAFASPSGLKYIVCLQNPETWELPTVNVDIRKNDLSDQSYLPRYYTHHLHGVYQVGGVGLLSCVHLAWVAWIPCLGLNRAHKPNCASLHSNHRDSKLDHITGSHKQALCILALPGLPKLPSETKGRKHSN